MTEVRAEITATVWQVNVEPGQAVEAGAQLIILESMKMEIPVNAPTSGTVFEVRVQGSDSIQEGDVLIVIDTG